MTFYALEEVDMISDGYFFFRFFVWRYIMSSSSFLTWAGDVNHFSKVSFNHLLWYVQYCKEKCLTYSNITFICCYRKVIWKRETRLLSMSIGYRITVFYGSFLSVSTYNLFGVLNRPNSKTLEILFTFSGAQNYHDTTCNDNWYYIHL